MSQEFVDKVNKYKEEKHSLDCYCTSFKDFREEVEYLAKQYKVNPDEVELNLDRGESYDDSYSVYAIFKVPKTQDEINAEAEKLKQNTETRKQRELEEFERLQKIYGKAE